METTKYWSRRLWTEEENEFVRKHYPTEGAPYCAKELGRAISAVQKHAQMIGVKYGSKYVEVLANGYIALRPWHGSLIMLHRVIAERKLGRRLREDELVHHIDGNKMNNHPDNLEIVTRSEHARIHHNNETHKFVAEPLNNLKR